MTLISTRPLDDAGFPAELLPALLAVSLTGICVLSPVYGPGGTEVVDFMVEYVSPAARHMLQTPENAPFSMLAHYPHTQSRGIFDFYRRVFEAGEAGRYEVNYQADGLDSYFYLAGVRQGDRVVGSFTDTADQPRSAVEEALRQSQARERAAHAEAEAQRQRLLALIEQAPALVAVLTGPAHVIELANVGFRQTLGHRPVANKTWRDALPELSQQHLFEALDDVYRTGETYFAYERMVRIDRTNSGRLDPFHFNFIYQATRDAADQITGVIVIATEVTEQVVARRQIQELNEELGAANKQLRASNTELEERMTNRTHALIVTLEQLEKRGIDLAQALATEQELGELKSRFVSMASHEFRTPLAVVLSSATLIAKYPGAEHQAQRLTHLSRIHTSVRHLNDILEEFLSVGRIEAGKVEAHPATLDLNVLVDETVANAQSTFKAGQTLFQQINCPAPFRLDASLLRKILVNLLSNAIKYSAENSVVTVRADCHDNLLVIHVQDQGIGISEEDQAHLFERFFRAGNAANIPGTGLGLYIIAEYIELMGGTIVLESELGVGTTVTLSIPYENHPAD
ncbi:ATP-binding protein [uncultured Hymenobacter sp.]|uniref:sensor histidine kinase n=1 Tax=uncultured Hymenobacter sp. TaxID=170016 RepID=UPI0035CB6D80